MLSMVRVPSCVSVRFAFRASPFVESTTVEREVILEGSK